MNGSAAERLRRLRWSLTLMFTVLIAIGLVLITVLAIDRDRQLTEQRLNGELGEVVAAVLRLVDYGQSISTVEVGQDPLNVACPEFAVLPGTVEPFEPHYSQQDCVAVEPRRLQDLAIQSVRLGQRLTGSITGAGGEPVWIRAEPFRNPDGQYVGAVVAASDPGDEFARHDRFMLYLIAGCVVFTVLVAGAGLLVSRREIRPAVTALEQQEVLLAETAHDLRTPVAALRALAETALRNPQQRADLLPRTVRLSARMGSIIDGLLVRARLAAGVEQLAIQPVWLDQLVSGVVEETPTEGARLTLTTAPTKVNADPVLVQRAIGNLLDNAMRYGRKPGEEAIVHITVAGGRVTVADHGPGIDASVAKDTLDRFSSSGGSSGLGLSIVSWVAQSHGGVLRVYNAEEGGAIFELVLPLAES
jgi:two-component system OmpR family sensor kinase